MSNDYPPYDYSDTDDIEVPEDFDKTCEEVLRDHIVELCRLGTINGMEDEEINEVLEDVLNERKGLSFNQPTFKIVGGTDFE